MLFSDYKKRFHVSLFSISYKNISHSIFIVVVTPRIIVVEVCEGLSYFRCVFKFLVE